MDCKVWKALMGVMMICWSSWRAFHKFPPSRMSCRTQQTRQPSVLYFGLPHSDKLGLWNTSRGEELLLPSCPACLASWEYLVGQCDTGCWTVSLGHWFSKHVPPPDVHTPQARFTSKQVSLTFSRDFKTLCLSLSFWILKAILCLAPLVTFCSGRGWPGVGGVAGGEKECNNIVIDVLAVQLLRKGDACACNAAPAPECYAGTHLCQQLLAC